MSTTSVFKENLQFVSTVARPRRVRKPKARIGINSVDEFNELVAKHGLKPEESQLLGLIEVKKLGYSQIAEIIGCTRQNVEQKYKAILRKMGYLSEKK